MAKRIAGTAASITIACLVLLQPLTCFAYTAEELYSNYGLEFPSPYDEDDLNTINDYNYAKRYTSMFRYVADSEYDTEIIEKRISDCEDRLAAIEKELLSSYGKSSSDIYQLESDYNLAKQQLEDAQNATVPIDIKVDHLNAQDVPTYSEYVSAMNRKRFVDHKCELGESKAIKLSFNAQLVKDYTDTYITYATTEGSGVGTLYNGTIVAIGGDHVTVNHYNGIISSYKGILPTVEVGDAVRQGDPIGTTYGEFSVKLKVANSLVDIYKLLEVSDEELQD